MKFKSKQFISRFMAVVLSVCMLMCSGLSTVSSYIMQGIIASAAGVTIVASGSCGAEGDNVTYTLDSQGTLTISGSGEMKNYINNVFSPFHWNSDIQKVIIKDGVTSIGYWAFENCTSLTSITISNSVTSIGKGTFYGCTGLTSIAIPNSVTSIGNSAFSGCSSLTSITIPNSVTSIDEGAFYNCTGLTSITIPNSVTSIGEGAFYNCTGLTSITIPDSVTSIGDFVFCDCTGLTSITIPNSVTSIGEVAFESCTGLTSITIPDSVTSIGDLVFCDCTGLISIEIPDSVTSIGGNAFGGCTGLTSITIPDSVTSINWCTFYGCTGLTSITIPDSVTSIGREAFSDCIKLKDVYYSGTKEEWNKISIQDYNENLTNAMIHYNSIISNLYYSSSNYVIVNGFNWGGTKFCFQTSQKDMTKAEADTIVDGITWTVSDPEVIQIESVSHNSYKNVKGTAIDIYLDIKAMKPGKVTITGATVDGNTASATIYAEPEISLFQSTSSSGAKNDFFNCQVKLNYDDKDYLEQFVKTLTVSGKNVNSQIGDIRISKESYGWLAKFDITAIGTGKTECTVRSPGGQFNTKSIDIDDDRYQIVDSGICGSEGNNITWTLDSMGVLVLTGTGTMQNYQKGQSPFVNDERIETMVMDFNIDSIGSYAFENCSELKNITFSYFMSEIGKNAFTGCSSIENIYNQNEITLYCQNGNYIDTNGENISELNNAKSKFNCLLLSTDGGNPHRSPTNLAKVTAIMPNYYDEISMMTLGEDVIYIAPDAFTNSPDLCIYGYEGSYAERYAKVNMYRFVDITPPVQNINPFVNGNSFKHSQFASAVDTQQKNLINNKSIKDKLYGLTNNIFDKHNLTKIMNEETWGGSCFGINSTILLTYANQIDLANFGSAKKYCDINLTENNGLYRDMINYYQLLQQIGKYGSKVAKRSSSKDFEKEMNILIEESEKVNNGNMPFILSIRFDNGGQEAGHSLTVCGGKKLLTGEYMLYLFDVNYSNDIYAGSEKSYGYERMIISSDRKNCYFLYPFGYSNILAVGHRFVSDYSEADLDGADNSISYLNNNPQKITVQEMSQKDIIKVFANNKSHFKIFDPSGNSLEFKFGSVSGNINIFNEYMSDNADSTSSTGFEIPYSQQYSITNLSNETDIAIGTYEKYYAFTGTDLKKIDVDFEKSVKIRGNKADCKIYVSDQNNENKLVNFKVNDFNQTEIDFNNKEIDVITDNPQKVKVVTITDDKTEERNVEIGDVYNNILIGTLQGDTNGDGKVTVADSLMIARYEVKLRTLTDEQLAVSDVNYDGKVTIADALKIARYEVKLIDSL